MYTYIYIYQLSPSTISLKHNGYLRESTAEDNCLITDCSERRCGRMAKVIDFGLVAGCRHVAPKTWDPQRGLPSKDILVSY
jgi:hypothetical protein